MNSTIFSGADKDNGNDVPFIDEQLGLGKNEFRRSCTGAKICLGLEGRPHFQDELGRE